MPTPICTVTFEYKALKKNNTRGLYEEIRYVFWILSLWSPTCTIFLNTVVLLSKTGGKQVAHVNSRHNYSNKNNDFSLDSLTIYNGPDVAMGTKIGQYCGSLGSFPSTLPNENKIKSIGKDIFLQFTTDGSKTDKGFRISYKEVCKFLILKLKKYSHQLQT